jgi:hypothetical protein
MGRRRRYLCSITCFSSPERVPIFGNVGLNRCRGQFDPTIGMTRIAMNIGVIRMAMGIGLTRAIPSITRAILSMTLVVQRPNCLIARNSKR